MKGNRHRLGKDLDDLFVTGLELGMSLSLWVCSRIGDR